MNEMKQFYNIGLLVKITILLLTIAHFSYYLVFKFLNIEVLSDLKLIEGSLALLATFFAFYTNKYYNFIIYFAHSSVLMSCALCTLMLGQDYGFIMVMILILSLGYVHDFRSIKYPIIISVIELVFFIITFSITWDVPSYESPYKIHIYALNLFGMTGLILFYSTFITKINQEERAELDKERAELDKKLNYDYLTNLLNRKSMQDILESYLYKTKQGKLNSFTIVLADIDDFKKINNEFGNTFGDIIIKNIANILKDSIAGMENTYISRWSDEEFLIILTDGNAQENKNFINNTRELIANYVHTDGYNSAKLTMTFGLCYVCRESSLDTALALSEKALNNGKLFGKNTVEMVVTE